jgi:ribulose-bisphosphate carboxylase large chain
MNECVPEVVKATQVAMKETGWLKLFSASITVDDPAEMIARGRYDDYFQPAYLREALQ